MQERRSREQYFFDQPTVDAAADLLEHFAHPCILCAPMVGVEMDSRGALATILDVDERFANLRGFRHWDILRPTPLDTKFDVIFCDPPFFTISLDRLFKAIRLLAQFDFTQSLALTCLTRRRQAALATFSSFHLQPTGLRLAYRTVDPAPKNDIELLANFTLPGHIPS
jgi:hypothetical protein